MSCLTGTSLWISVCDSLHLEINPLAQLMIRTANTLLVLLGMV